MDQDQDEPMDMAAVPFDDEEDEQEPQPQDVSGLDPSSLSGIQLPGTAIGGGVSIGGLEDEESLSSHNHKKRQQQTTPSTQPKPRKRRKVVIDNDKTELSTDHIKSMIANTSDLQRQKSHPADWNPNRNDRSNMDMNMDTSPSPDHHHHKNNNKSLWRPFLAQHGACHPALQDLWDQSYYQALERPCPFAKKQQEDEEEVEDGSIEETRRQQEEEQSETMEVPVMDDMDDEFPTAEQEPQDVGDTVWPQHDEEEEEEEPPLDEYQDQQHDSLAFATDMADMQST
jgi:hypothetical protein